MAAAEPMEVSWEALKKLVTKAYPISKKLPARYPTVQEIDAFLESKEYQEDQIREDAFKFFVMCLIYGFTRDRAWHAANPGKRYITSENMIYYIMNPLTGEKSLKPHVGIWRKETPEAKKEDIQAAFEYMQSIVMDTSLYVIKAMPKPCSQGAAAGAAIA